MEQGDARGGGPLRSALEMGERLYPPARHPQGHPDLAAYLSNLGTAPGSGDAVGARPTTGALEMRERLYPPDSSRKATGPIPEPDRLATASISG
ncbi:MAG: hypothetical protein WKF75_02915 [Singulisphaera sp.]